MILFGSNVDTELLALRSIIDDLPEELGPVDWFNPDRVEGLPPLDQVSMVVLRLLGGEEAWSPNFRQLQQVCQELNIALVAAGGENHPDAELLEASSVPSGVAEEAHRYLSAGGPENVGNLLRFLSDTVNMTGVGFDPPIEIPEYGVWNGAGLGKTGLPRNPSQPLVAVVFYRAHLVAGNTSYVSDLCRAIEDAGGEAIAIWTYSLRRDNADGTVAALSLCVEYGADVIITSTLAAGSAADDGDDWSVPGLAEVSVPVIQAPATSRSRQEWLEDDAGLPPHDVATGVAIPEFDGRIIGPTYAFKEVVDEGSHPGAEIIATRADPERSAHLARLAIAHAELGRVETSQRRIAIVLSAYPTNRSRLGNAVGLDTPSSTISLLNALASEGYQLNTIPTDGDALMDELATNFTYDQPRLSAAQLQAAAGSFSATDYQNWFRTLPDDAQSLVENVWGDAPGEVYFHENALHFPGLDLGNVLVSIQPPRGFGTDPIGTYHAPDLPPPHHYLAFYRWLATPQDEGGWGAHAIVHLGKHGTLEWLPGKALAPAAGCFPSAALGEVPFFYPFVVNDPGEGAQAKRRTHAVIIDHLPPPLTRADTYDDLARLEQLLDLYAQSQGMDPGKLPALRAQVWDLMVQAEIHRDLDLGDHRPDDTDFDDLLVHVDGYLCALKDAQIRGGLHTLGRGPSGDELVETILGVTRLPQGNVPSLRESVAAKLGIDLAQEIRSEIDLVEAECRQQVEALASNGWACEETDDETLQWVSKTLVPNLARTSDEVTNLIAALAGRPVPSGPSGAPSRGAAHVLPTGRNFYSLDPKAVPSPLSWEVGNALANKLLERQLKESNEYPRTVGLVLWGTAAMRTAGDDAAMALALLGVKPEWNPENQRITGLRAIPIEELGRPRVDVTLRISGFFRDAFPHVIALLDDAVALVASLDEGDRDNPIRAAGVEDARLWGPPPGGYGSGLLEMLVDRSWRSETDLAEVYLAWSGFAYGRNRFGEAQPEGMRRRFGAIEIAVKNQDNREHDIFDSGDYAEEHGGMVAAVKALRGEAPKAWFGDSSNPANPQVRSLKEEAARVVRSRVLNPKWIEAMQRHGYKGAFELAATVDYLFNYDATTQVVDDWMYEQVTQAYVADPAMRKFFEASNPWALTSIAEKLLEADERDLWDASKEARQNLVDAILEAEGWEESR